MLNKIKNILENNKIEYEIYEHEPILDYETAHKVKERLNFIGVESKSLFLKGKSGNYYVFVSIEGQTLDSKKIKSILNEKVRICSSQELIEVTRITPGCVSPFGYDKEISLVVDESIFNYDKFILSPGIPEVTLIVNTKDIGKILDNVENKVINY